MIVYVVAYETPESCGGHDWFYDPADADRDYKQIVESKDYEIVVRFKAVVPDHAEGTITIQEITDLIDQHCWYNRLDDLHNTTQEIA